MGTPFYVLIRSVGSTAFIHYEKALKWSLLVLAFTPLIVSPITLFPYIFGKTVFIRLAITAFSVIFLFSILKFREEAVRNIKWSRLKSPIFLSFLFFTALALLSVFFAVDPRVAFWGDLERGEGFLILFYMLLFLAGSNLFFHRRDWLTFFKLSLFSGSAVALDAMIYFIKSPAIRPLGSFIGNPAFISVYLLFVIFSAFIVASASRNNRFWSAISALSVLLSAAALMATKTRGVFVGIFVAILAVAVYSALTGEKRTIRFFNSSVPVRKIGGWVLACIVLLLMLFVGTKTSPVWQIVPGLDRLAQISFNDATTQTRLINFGVSLDAVHPGNVGVGRTLLGWGPENFSQAYNRFYDPAIQKYEATWFDRAHNKLMDVLVMNGILGLLVYLVLWFYVFRSIFSSRRGGLPEDVSRAPLIFFGVSYFIQNLFLFDQITTYIPLFAFFGYLICLRRSESGDTPPPLSQRFSIPTSATLSAILIALFIWTAAIPFYQTSLYALHLYTPEFSFTSENISRMLSPFNYVQAELRSNILFKLSPQSADARVRDTIQQVLDIEKKQPSLIKPIALSSKAAAYIALANFGGAQRAGLLTKAEDVLREITELSPGRQSVMYSLAENYVSQGKFEEAAVLADKMLAVEPDSLQARILWLAVVIPQDWGDERRTFEKVKNTFGGGGIILENVIADFLRNSFNNYIQSSFIDRDADRLARVLQQAIRLEELMVEINRQQIENGQAMEQVYDNSSQLQKALDALQTGGWPALEKSTFI